MQLLRPSLARLALKGLYLELPGPCQSSSCPCRPCPWWPCPRHLRSPLVVIVIIACVASRAHRPAQEQQQLGEERTRAGALHKRAGAQRSPAAVPHRRYREFRCECLGSRRRLSWLRSVESPASLYPLCAPNFCQPFTCLALVPKGYLHSLATWPLYLLHLAILLLSPAELTGANATTSLPVETACASLCGQTRERLTVAPFRSAS